MRFIPLKNSSRRRETGGVTLELTLLLPIFMVLVFGIIDFGHAIYMMQLVSNASREGARYASHYHTDSSGNHLLPNGLTPTINNFVVQTSAQNGGKGGFGLAGPLPSDSNPHVVTGDLTDSAKSPGYTSGATGDAITVTVTARKNWFVIDNFIPSLGSYKDLTATTVMTCE